MNFQPGDKCVILPVPPGAPPDHSSIAHFVGAVTTIIGYFGRYPTVRGIEDWWVTDLISNSGPVFAADCRLQKLPPPEQKREPLGSWEDCPWKPPIEVTV